MPCLEVFVMDTTQKTPSPRSAPNTGARRAAWRILQREGRRLEETPLRTLLENPGRPAQLRLEAAGLIADFSIRFVAVVFLIATASFLTGTSSGADSTWAAMVGAELGGVDLNPWAVVSPTLAIIVLTACPALLLELRMGGKR